MINSMDNLRGPNKNLVIPLGMKDINLLFTEILLQGSHFFGLTKFHDISMIFPGFSQKFQVYFELF